MVDAMRDPSPWRLHADLAWGRLLVAVATLDEDATLRPDVHLFLGDRYWWLARRHHLHGRRRRAERLVRKARWHLRLGGGPEPPPFAAAAMPVPRPELFTSAIGPAA